MSTDLYTIRAWEQISYLCPQSSQDHVREVWNLILKPVFPHVSIDGEFFTVTNEDDQDRFPQIAVANPIGRFPTVPLFKVYCIGFPAPDTDMWKELEDAVQLDLLEASSLLEGKPRASLFAAIAIGPLVRFYRLDEEDYFCYVEYRDRDAYDIHRDFNVIVEHLLQIRGAMA
ncbi:hypothetical protein ALT_7528 [Aspergillus lentulus]|uniref:Uncharacterized protein n=1 Tax=Aspergillus lentulus TaxID=293939 RepID=A0AAN5YLK8_ASPLE|nr:uncharacterized protein IFM58399_03129 [Aspergillus lentulus]KAF4153168.1 hypothetical protein CNMCM6069_001130 [Aspergillus lentulus]KAF4163020.1 hypothetical protein CNMCM6936_001329 [Aspergillus lentulus]KAF4172352.1 hypothetical protein CNMCM8060_001649 [Aspergillus lentulus]KAF4184471.1 hypothetical protein CNMCM7927_007837 [Aspergillus lentulus]KAF4192091.1 hypothetical protein CNMCM8694_000938 [Aspergillus lentulus]